MEQGYKLIASAIIVHAGAVLIGSGVIAVGITHGDDAFILVGFGMTAGLILGLIGWVTMWRPWTSSWQSIRHVHESKTPEKSP